MKKVLNKFMRGKIWWTAVKTFQVSNFWFSFFFFCSLANRQW